MWRGEGRKLSADRLWGPLLADRLGILPGSMPTISLRQLDRIHRYFEAERKAHEDAERGRKTRRGH